MAEQGKTKLEAEAKREAKLEYLKRKAEVSKKEEENHRYIYIFRTENEKWYKIGWNSLLIYRYLVAPRVQNKPRVRNDGDFGSKSPTGIISMRDDGVSQLLEKLKPLNIFESREQKSNKAVRVIDLGYDVSEEDLEKFRHAEELKRERLNELVPTGVTMPELEAKLTEILRCVHQLYKSMGKLDREAFGKEICKHPQEALKYYRRMTWKGLKPDDALKKIYVEVSGLMLEMNVLGRADLIDLDLAARIAEYTLDARNMLNGRLGVPVQTADKGVKKTAQEKTVFGAEK